MNFQEDIERASSLLKQGKFVDSIALSAVLVARDSNHAVAAHLLGLGLKESGDWAQGEQWLRRSIRLEPGRPEFHANLANLLRRRGKFRQAENFYRSALQLQPQNKDARRSLALTLNDLSRFDEAESACRALLAVEPEDAESWVLLGLTQANVGRLEESAGSYRRALQLDPSNAVAHHNLGALLSAMEQPEAAFALLESARAHGADGYELEFNRGRALLDMSEIDGAESSLARAVALRPSNIDGQLLLARVRFMLGDPKFARSLADASRVDRDNLPLQSLFAEVLWRAGNLQGAEAVLRDLVLRKGANPQVQATLAAVLHESGRLDEAESQALEAATSMPSDPVIVETLVSIMLSRGRPADAMPFIKTHRLRMPGSQSWIAYEATAARLLGDELYQHLFDYDRVVRVFEIEAPRGWSSMKELNAALAATLATRHRYRNHPLDQSLRNGTQTSRSLLSDPDLAIKAILQAFAEPIQEYRRLIGQDPAHPLSARNLGDSQFTGAWSVRLRRDGYHVNHFHPEGWASSAYYIDVPPEVADASHKSGWLKFGESRYTVPGMTAARFIQPVPGQLVLFPSYMWHGTNAIREDAPRLTIAFDIKPAG